MFNPLVERVLPCILGKPDQKFHLTLRPLESCTETVMKGDWRSAVLCMTSLSRWNERYVREDSFTGGALENKKRRDEQEAQR